MGTLAWLRANEPVRALVYPALGLMAGYLVVNGVVDADLAQLITAVFALVLGVPATEVTRSRVTPNGRVSGAAAAAAYTALSEAEDAISGAFGAEGANLIREVRERVEQTRSGPRHRGA